MHYKLTGTKSRTLWQVVQLVIDKWPFLRQRFKYLEASDYTFMSTSHTISRRLPGYMSSKCSKEMPQCCLERRAFGLPYNASGFSLMHTMHQAGDREQLGWNIMLQKLAIRTWKLTFCLPGRHRPVIGIASHKFTLSIPLQTSDTHKERECSENCRKSIFLNRIAMFVASALRSVPGRVATSLRCTTGKAKGVGGARTHPWCRGLLFSRMPPEVAGSYSRQMKGRGHSSWECSKVTISGDFHKQTAKLKERPVRPTQVSLAWSEQSHI